MEGKNNYTQPRLYKPPILYPLMKNTKFEFNSRNMIIKQKEKLIYLLKCSNTAYHFTALFKNALWLMSQSRHDIVPIVQHEGWCVCSNVIYLGCSINKYRFPELVRWRTRVTSSNLGGTIFPPNLGRTIFPPILYRCYKPFMTLVTSGYFRRAL